MLRDLVFGGVTALACISLAATQQPPAAPPANETPAAPAVVDPAAVTFASDAGLVLHAVKPSNAENYEAVILALQGALASAQDARTRAVAASWRVFKADPEAVAANHLYVHLLLPPVAGVDYRPSIWLDELLTGAPPDLLAKYRDAFAAPPTMLPLTEFANMAVAPVVAPRPPGASGRAR